MTDQELQDYDDSFLNEEHPLYYDNYPEESDSDYDVWYNYGYGNGYNDAVEAREWDNRIDGCPNDDCLRGYEDGYAAGYEEGISAAE